MICNLIGVAKFKAQKVNALNPPMLPQAVSLEPRYEAMQLCSIIQYSHTYPTAEIIGPGDIPTYKS